LGDLCAGRGSPVTRVEDEGWSTVEGRFTPLLPASERGFLDARAREFDHRRLVQLRGLDTYADLRCHLGAALDQSLLSRLCRFLAVPEDDRLGAVVVLVVERDVAGVAVVG